MSSKRQTSVAKRQKVSNEAILVQSSECVTFGALVDPEYPLDLIGENLLRMLMYETNQGIGEIIALAVRAAGCTIEFELTGIDASAHSVVREAEAIEHACLMSEDGAPADYPLLKTFLSKRTVQVLGTVCSALAESTSTGVLRALARYMSAIASLKLQSLRYVGTVFVSAVAKAYGEIDASVGRSVLISVLTDRVSDVALAIRKTAAAGLVEASEITQVLPTLNDLNGGVRASLLRALISVSIPKLDDAAWGRIGQMAVSDVDLAVRRAALKFLVAKRPTFDYDLTPMLYDEDELSRRLAAESIICNLSSDARSAVALLERVASDFAHLLCNKKIAETVSLALVHGLEKVRTQFQGSRWALELGRLLIAEPPKKGRKQSSYRDQRSVMIDSKEKQISLLMLLNGAARTSGGLNGELLGMMPALLRRTQHDDILVANAIIIASLLPQAKLLEKVGSERKLSQIYASTLDLFLERSSTQVMEAFATMLASMPISLREQLLDDAYQELRIKFATMLGPKGNYKKANSADIRALVSRFIVLSRFYDISDLSKLPIWTTVASGDASMIHLARALGVKGDEALAKLVVEKTRPSSSRAAHDIMLQVLISAKLRNLDLGMAVDANEVSGVSEPVWAAAVAAGVF